MYYRVTLILGDKNFASLIWCTLGHLQSAICQSMTSRMTRFGRKFRAVLINLVIINLVSRLLWSLIRHLAKGGTARKTHVLQPLSLFGGWVWYKLTYLDIKFRHFFGKLCPRTTIPGRVSATPLHASPVGDPALRESLTLYLPVKNIRPPSGTPNATVQNSKISINDDFVFTACINVLKGW